jgi:hypothetical protein
LAMSDRNASIAGPHPPAKRNARIWAERERR